MPPPRAKKGRHSNFDLMLAHDVELSQAARVIRKFGGASALRRCLIAHGYKVSYAVVYKWLQPREKGGTGGRIPARAMERIARVALLEGIYLTSEDLDPRPLKVKLTRQETDFAREDGSYLKPVVSTEVTEVMPPGTEDIERELEEKLRAAKEPYLVRRFGHKDDGEGIF